MRHRLLWLAVALSGLPGPARSQQLYAPFHPLVLAEETFDATVPSVARLSENGIAFVTVALTDEGATNGLRIVDCSFDFPLESGNADDWELFFAHGEGTCLLGDNVESGLFGLSDRQVKVGEHTYFTVTGENPGETAFCPKIAGYDASFAYDGSTCIADDGNSISNDLIAIDDQLCNATHRTATDALRVHCASKGDLGAWTTKLTVADTGGPDGGYNHFRIEPYTRPTTGDLWILVLFPVEFTGTLFLAGFELATGGFVSQVQLSDGAVDRSEVPAGGYLDAELAVSPGLRIAAAWSDGRSIDFKLIDGLGTPSLTSVAGTITPGDDHAPGDSFEMEFTGERNLRFFRRKTLDFGPELGQTVELLIVDQPLGGPGEPLPPFNERSLRTPLVDRPLAMSPDGFLITDGGGLRLGVFSPAEIFATGFELQSLELWSAVVGGPP